MIFEQIIDHLRNNPRQAMLAKIAGIGLVAFVIFVLMINLPTSQPSPLRDISLSSEGFPSLQGDSIVYYNGVAFVRADLNSGKSSVLSKPMRLPNITSLHVVGDSGALATFSGSLSTTPAEWFLSELAVDSLDDTIMSSILWYIDFKSGEISTVPTSSVDNAAYYYSPNNKNAYYVSAYIPPLETGEASPLRSTAERILYKLSSDSNEPVEVAKITEAGQTGQYVFPCLEYEICVVTKDNNQKNVLYGFDNQKLSKIFESSDLLLPTGDPDKLLSYKTFATDKKTNVDDTSVTGDDTEYYLYSIADKKIQKTGIRVGGVVGLVPLVNKNSLTLYLNINSTDLNTVHRTPSVVGVANVSKSSKNTPDTTPKNTILAPSFATTYSYDKPQLITSSNKSSTLYAGPGKLPTKPKTPPTELIQSCVQQHGSEVEYTAMHSLYTLYVPVSGAFAATVEQIGDCILKNPSDTFGYTFQVMGTSPESGRIITD